METTKPVFTQVEIDAIAALRRLDAAGGMAEHSDEFLSYFIFARKLDVPRAYTLLQNHMKWRVEMDIDNLNLVAIKRVLMSGVFAFLPPEMRGPHGEGVGFILAQHLPDEMVTDVKLMMQLTWFLTDRLYKGECK